MNVNRKKNNWRKFDIFWAKMIPKKICISISTEEWTTSKISTSVHATASYPFNLNASLTWIWNLVKFDEWWKHKHQRFWSIHQIKLAYWKSSNNNPNNHHTVSNQCSGIIVPTWCCCCCQCIRKSQYITNKSLIQSFTVNPTLKRTIQTSIKSEYWSGNI